MYAYVPDTKKFVNVFGLNVRTGKDR